MSIISECAHSRGSGIFPDLGVHNHEGVAMKRLITLIIIAVAGIAVVGCGTTKVVTQPAAQPATTTQQAPTPAPVADPAPVAQQPQKPQMTAGQENALESARSYLDMGGFSRKGLIEQLSSSAGEGFTQADARYAADRAHADWNQQAVESAQGYLDMGGFSRASLLDQLTSSAGEGFTQEQARYAVSKVYH